MVDVEDLICKFVSDLNSFDKICDLKEIDVELTDYIYRLKLLGERIGDISECNKDSFGFFYAKKDIPNPYLKGLKPSELYIAKGIVKFTRDIIQANTDLVTVRDTYFKKGIETDVFYNLEPLFIDNNPSYERLLVEDGSFYHDNSIDALDVNNFKLLTFDDEMFDDEMFDDEDDDWLNCEDEEEDDFYNYASGFNFMSDISQVELKNRQKYDVHRLNLEESFMPLQVNIKQRKFYGLSNNTAAIIEHDAYSNIRMFFYDISSKSSRNYGPHSNRGTKLISLESDFDFSEVNELDRILSKSGTNKREDLISFSNNMSDKIALVKTNRQKVLKEKFFKDIVPQLKF